jgi:hypothetical protein
VTARPLVARRGAAAVVAIVVVLLSATAAASGRPLELPHGHGTSVQVGRSDAALVQRTRTRHPMLRVSRQVTSALPTSASTVVARPTVTSLPDGGDGGHRAPSAPRQPSRAPPG